MMSLASAAAALLAIHAGAVGVTRLRGRLANSAYPSPADADAELDAIAAADGVGVESYGQSQQGRPLRALRFARTGEQPPAARTPRVLVTGHIHAGEFVGGYVARALARSLADARSEAARALRERAEVVVAPLLNPDGAERVWNANGWTGLRSMRMTAAGVDPNRNFPHPVAHADARRAWNSGRASPRAAHYRGPHPLSEPECAALAALCARERFCGAIHFHSFGGVVYAPMCVDAFAPREGDSLEAAFGAIQRSFAAHQESLVYRWIPEHPETIEGQLDAFLVGAFGVASVTVEVGRPGFGYVDPRRFGNLFWLFNPRDPERWARNDVDATLRALAAVAEATGGTPAPPPQPELADASRWADSN